MRIALALALVGLAAAPGAASPRSREDSSRSRADSSRSRADSGSPEPRALPATVEQRRRPEQRRWAESYRREAPASADGGDIAMPPLWNELRIKICEQLPSGGLDLGFSYTVMPIAITGANDTTAPGLGVSGTF